MDDSLNKAWKEFGKQTEAGKLLYQLYGVRYRPDKLINYPKLKVKTNEEKQKEEINKKRQNSSKKISDAVHKIDYPDMKRNRSTYKFNKIDLIPKRKKENEIKKEIYEIKLTIERENKNNKFFTNDPISNRKMKIEKLQEKFMFQERTVMPKGARLPGLKLAEDSAQLDTQDKKPSEPKFDHDTHREELDYLYDQIMKEIDERYEYMEELKKLGRKDMDMKIMSEIKDRIDELKRIQKMINEYDKGYK